MFFMQLFSHWKALLMAGWYKQCFLQKCQMELALFIPNAVLCQFLWFMWRWAMETKRKSHFQVSTDVVKIICTYPMLFVWVRVACILGLTCFLTAKTKVGFMSRDFLSNIFPVIMTHFHGRLWKKIMEVMLLLVLKLEYQLSMNCSWSFGDNVAQGAAFGPINSSWASRLERVGNL